MAPSSQEQKDFEKRWLHETTADHEISIVSDLAATREFAYKSFDRLDKDGNGFVETNELLDFLEGNELNNREKSFVAFLLNNREQIAAMCDEGQQSPEDGISRCDLEKYFELLASLL